MVTLQKLFYRIIPDSIKRIVDPVTATIDKFVISIVADLEPNHLVLDAGAGECRFKDRLKEDVRYIAVDTTWGDGAWDYSNIDVISQLENLPFTSEVFDSIICTQVLEHVKEPQAVLNELFRILKQEGIICLTAPQGWGVHQAPHDYFRFTNYGLFYLLKKAGFEEVTVTPSCGYFGYLANRITIIPKMLFWQIKNKVVRSVLFPLELISYALFVVGFPLILNAIDPIDRKQDYTLNYLVKGKKTGGQRKS